MSPYLMTSLSDIVYLIIVLVIGYFLGKYIYKYIFLKQDIKFISKVINPVQNFILKLGGIDSTKEFRAKNYLLHVLAFSLIGFVLLLILLLIQGYLFLNPNHISNMSFSQAFNTAISYVTNTNWQSYSGENDVTYLTQSLGLTTQNFISAAVGISILFVLIRCFTNKDTKLVGNFYLDLIRTILYLLLPLSIIGSIILVSQGVPQTYIENIGYNSLNSLINNSESTLPLGPVASQVIIKLLGSNGGGFYGANSAFPYENPSAFTNMMQSVSILIIPVSLCFTFGFAVKDKKQGYMLLQAMTFLFIVALILCTISEYGYVTTINGVDYKGNWNGKESRFGIGESSFWSVATTATSNGSSNSIIGDYSPTGTLVLLFLMELGEVVYGGVGSGLYGMLAFVILTIFISGLMIGKTPEYLGKKIDSFDMKMVCLLILPSPVLAIFGTAITTMSPSLYQASTVNGSKGFTGILYGFTSLANNNGSAFNTFNSNTTYTNIFGGFIMVISRFVPIFAVVMLSGNLSKKKFVSVSPKNSLKTNNTLFAILLVGIILIVGALSFFPSWALGPISGQLDPKNWNLGV